LEGEGTWTTTMIPSEGHLLKSLREGSEVCVQKFEVVKTRLVAIEVPSIETDLELADATTELCRARR